MSQPKSILDKIIQSKNIEEASRFNPSEIIADLTKELNAKEREVLTRRFGLNGQPAQTLEQIGKNFEITRERIRQIQGAAVRKLRELAELRQKLSILEHTVTRVLHEHGGIAESEHFYRQLLSHLDDAPGHRPATEFVLSQLLTDRIEPVRPSEHFYEGWKHKAVELDFVRSTLDAISEIIDGQKRALKLQELLGLLREHPHYRSNRERILPLGSNSVESDEEAIDNALKSYLVISKKIERNILDEWGLASWPHIRPRRMGDKIYLILKQVGKPLHFTDITDSINRAQFDHKVAYPATIHNELILDDRYVLVGRGLYALREWGFEPGTVSDVIVSVLREVGRPLSRDEVVAEVNKRRFVRKSTVYLALTNKERFAKVGDRFQLVGVAAP